MLKVIINSPHLLCLKMLFKITIIFIPLILNMFEDLLHH